MCYLLRNPINLSYRIYDSTTKKLSVICCDIFCVSNARMTSCYDMELTSTKATWGSRSTWFRIIVKWEGLPSDLPIAYPELFV